MRNPRIFQDSEISINSTIELSDDAFGHIVRVLRLKDGDAITLFNGRLNDGHYGDYHATLCNVAKKSAQATIDSFEAKQNESPLNLHLGQGISRGDRMDYTLQKSVELGVSEITPLFTERCGVKLSGDRLQKKVDQWQKIVISACEQSGRAKIPVVHQPVSLEDWLVNCPQSLKLNLHPKAEHSIMSLPNESKDIALLVGPEGGLSDQEIESAHQRSFIPVLLGPRVLRTETAALTAITALQCRFGDLG